MQKTSHFAAAELGAGADQALQFIDQAGERASLLVEEWIKSGNAAAVQAAAELGQGPARKAARRGLNVLKARGVNIPAAPRIGRLEQDAGAAREAWLLPPDSSGVEAIVLAERQPSGSYQACFAFFREGREILRVQGGLLALSKLEQNMRASLGGAGYAPVAVPWDWAKFRIVERRAWHAARKVAEPLGWMGTEKLLADPPTEAPPHPLDTKGLQGSDAETASLARDSAVLHQWAEFRSWLPAERAVQELLVHIGRKFGPTPPTAREEIDPILREQVAAATDRYFTPERRTVLANRMQDSALSVLDRIGDDAGRHVAAVIRTIRGAGLITNPPSDVKFLTGFFDKALGLVAAQQGGRLRVPIPAPVAAPADAAAAGSAAPADPEDPLGPDEGEGTASGDQPSS
jgi:hypothetical protein